MRKMQILLVLATLCCCGRHSRNEITLSDLDGDWLMDWPSVAALQLDVFADGVPRLRLERTKAVLKDFPQRFSFRREGEVFVNGEGEWQLRRKGELSKVELHWRNGSGSTLMVELDVEVSSGRGEIVLVKRIGADGEGKAVFAKVRDSRYQAARP